MKTRTTLPNRTGLAVVTDTPDLAYLDPGEIRGDGGTQMRAFYNADTLDDYAAVMLEHSGWGPFPPVVVYYDGGAYWLADGFHRLAALRRTIETAPPLEDRRAPATVRPGTRRDAILHAAGANAAHGLRRTTADKRRSVQTLLRDEEWRTWSDAEIARRCLVDPKTVAAARRELTATREIPDSKVRKTAAGRTINTQNIGTNQPAPKKAAPIETVPTVQPGTWDAGAISLTRDWSQTEFDDYVAAVAWEPPPVVTTATPLAPAPTTAPKPTPAPKTSTSGPPLPGPAPLAYATARRQNLHHLLDLYSELLATLDDYEKLTGDFGQAAHARKAIRPMLATVERNLGLVPSEQEAAHDHAA